MLPYMTIGEAKHKPMHIVVLKSSDRPHNELNLWFSLPKIPVAFALLHEKDDALTWVNYTDIKCIAHIASTSKERYVLLLVKVAIKLI
jgi:hypothetical protein